MCGHRVIAAAIELSNSAAFRRCSRRYLMFRNGCIGNQQAFGAVHMSDDQVGARNIVIFDTPTRLEPNGDVLRMIR
jgi:hypothetical protein